MAEDRVLHVTDAAGNEGRGWIEERPEGSVLVVRYGDGLEQRYPVEALRDAGNGRYRLELDDLEIGALEAVADEAERRVIPLVAEEARVGKREHHTRVVVHKAVETRTETLEVPLHRTEVEVKRVPVNRVLEEPAEVRTEGDTTIIPVMIERPVVYTEIVLVEELHLIRRELSETYREDVTLREEVVSVEREALEDA